MNKQNLVPFVTLLLGILICGCAHRGEERVQVKSVTFSPQHIETYMVTVDDTITVPGMDMDGNLKFKTEIVGSHQEQRQRIVPAQCDLEVKCSHGIFHVTSLESEYPKMHRLLKPGDFCAINYSSNRFGVSHPKARDDLYAKRRYKLEQ